jgi:hypothetical protein
MFSRPTLVGLILHGPGGMRDDINANMGILVESYYALNTWVVKE